MSLDSSSPVGHQGRVTATGAIRPGGLGEVMVAVRGGVEVFLARDADDGAIEPYEEIAVVEQIGAQTVLVTRLHPAGDPAAQPSRPES